MRVFLFRSCPPRPTRFARGRAEAEGGGLRPSLLLASLVIPSPSLRYSRFRYSLEKGAAFRFGCSSLGHGRESNEPTSSCSRKRCRSRRKRNCPTRRNVDEFIGSTESNPSIKAWVNANRARSAINHARNRSKGSRRRSHPKHFLVNTLYSIRVRRSSARSISPKFKTNCSHIIWLSFYCGQQVVYTDSRLNFGSTCLHEKITVYRWSGFYCQVDTYSQHQHQPHERRNHYPVSTFVAYGIV